MGHWSILFSIIFTACFCYSYGCQIEGANWPVPVTASALDTFRGVILDRATTGIDGINLISYGEVLNSGPYVDVSFTDSRLIIATNDAYQYFEEYETSFTMPITITFRCTGGTTLISMFVISVTDTNNNAPQFLPSDNFVFSIAAPVPPGFEITGCLNDLTVRDIDLTTQRIDFAIIDNPNFEIEYDAASSNTVKEFKAILRTTTLIRTVPEPIIFTISATDVDLTGDPQLTTTATVTIIGNTDFELPEEPVFSETFYRAEYTDANQLVLTQPITLQSGYDELVRFTIEGEWSNNFEIVAEGNQVSIRVVTPLAGDVLLEKQILLVVRANREYTSGASATVVVRLPEGVPLEFERAHYEGTIENNNLQVSQLILSQGYEGESVSVIVLNEYSSYFTAVVQGNVITLSMTALDEDIINQNSFINLVIVASTDSSSATAIVTLEMIKDDNVTPVFNSPIYTGSYNPGTGLAIQEILLLQGYDESVLVFLEGEYANFFQVTRNGPVVSVYALTIPPEVYAEGQITLSLEARKPRTVGANAVLIITLPAARELEFETSTYRGSLQNNVISLETIRLTVGYDDSVFFSISGDYASYFSLTNVQGQVTINLITPFPNDILSENNIVILTLAASGQNAVTTTTSVLLDIIKDDTTTPVFSRNIYYGTYLGTSNIVIDNINLAQGFDDDVTFQIEGDHAEYFDITNTGNNVVLSLRTSIPEEVIFNEKVLLFNVLAEKPLTVGANAVVLIRFPSELTDPVVMRFTENTYTGTIENNLLTVNNIILSSGYTAGTDFVLTGEYSSHFAITNINNGISLSLLNTLPSDAIENPFIVLEIEARRERAVSVWTSVVINVIKEEITSPIFSEAYYRGVYNTDSGLQFNGVISLLSGYDETVIFQLDGEYASLFTLVQIGSNTLSVAAVAPITDAVLADNSHLLLTVIAMKPGATTARAVISIDIEKDNTEGSNIGFDRVTYLGSLQNDLVDLGPITIINGYTEDITLGLYGDLASYFITTRAGPIVNVVLQTPIPTQMIPADGIITMDLRASAPNSATAYAAIVLGVVNDAASPAPVQLAFDAAYYIGSYNTSDGLLLEATITLSQGYDDSVQFALRGENSQWFSINAVQNSVTLVVSSAIPGAVLTDQRQLVFLVIAQRPGAITANATIIISLTADDYTEGSNIGFDRVTYLGSLQNDLVDLGPITIINGYTEDITLGLYGDLASYFTTTRAGPIVNVVLQTPIPTQMIPADGIITMDLRASAPNSATAYAAIVLGVVNDAASPAPVQLAFDAAYYIGSYSTSDGLLVEATITLSQGYDDSVQFALQGENSQWFSINAVQNSVTLVVSSAIPGAVLTDQRQLVFLVIAQRPGAITANATIIISLTADDYTEGSNIGFDRVTYLGSLQNDLVDLGPITIINGYTEDITLGLYGDLASYFTTTRAGPIVNVVLQTPIPTQMIPADGIITMDLRASAPNSATAYAAIVLGVVNDAASPAPVQLAFHAAYYIGSYNTSDGLLVEATITLSQGYDDSVQFALQGENSQWFSINAVQNSVTLVVSSAIPGAVLTDQRQLVFLVIAQRPGAITANATIIISLTADDYTEGSNIGFDRVTYLGSLQNDLVDLGPITIINGYTEDITLGLYGDLASYFTTTRAGPIVNVVLQTPIPTQMIPADGIITMDLRASAPNSATAYAAIVLGVVNDAASPAPVQLAFDAAYYIGSYNTSDGLLLEATITLSQGYDDSVQFALQGENSQWFSINAVQNSVTLVVSSAIPGAVLTDQRQLVFLVIAQRPGAITANATIIISLTADDYTEGSNIGFDRVTYLGSLQNDLVYLGPITIINGYTEDITLGLYGDLASYFTTTRAGPIVNVMLQTPIPTQMIPADGIITMDLRASAPNSATAYAAIVLGVVNDAASPAPVQLAFDAAYYIGSYNTSDGLLLEATITLSQGYDDSVQFALQGENSQWFSINAVQNSVTLVVSSAIPGAVLTDQRQLVFLVIAQRPVAITANATIIISLTADDYTEGSNIGFDRVTYLGSLQNDLVDLGPITIINGYTEDITLGLYGDLASYFTTTRAGPIVNVVLQTPIPTQMIPADGIITMDLRASAPNSATAYAAIVLGVVNDAASPAPVQLAFDAAYYIGSYNTSDGLLLEATITLSQGYDDSVQFALQGENSQWFSINAVQNSVTLVVSSAIPGAVLTDQRQLVFLVIAQRPGAITANATIIISLTADDYTEGSNIGFDRVTYLGSLQNDLVDLGPITIINGYTEDITLGLYGDLASYFTTTRAGPIVNVVLQTPIPTQMIPADGIITMDLRASAPNSATAYAAIVLGVVNDAASPAPVQLAFDAAYYIGSYSTSDGLLVEATITLSQGYDDSVQFALQGENSQWFSINAVQNSVTLVVSSAIPGAVLTDQRQLVFLVIAQRPGAITANATIIISLTADDYTEGSNIGFDRVTYLGSLQNDLVDLGPITIINGYTEDITLGLYGDLASYFTTTRAGPIVNVVLQTPIPTQMIPADGIITMDLRASAPNSATAYAAIVLGVVNDAASPAPVQLAFDAAYYIGSYNTSDGLLLEATITLSQGYDDSVQFALQGENSQWFSINAVQNSVTLVVSSAIPGAVLTDQRQLVFLVIAQRPGAITANATIIISLTADDYTEGSNIGFDRVTYLGSLQNDLVYLGPITIINGYTEDITLGLYGDLASYFTTTRAGPIVNVMLQTPIPTQMIPADGIITMDLRASAPNSATAYAAIVLGVVNDAASPAPVQLAFDAAYYIGSYNTSDGLLLEATITLSQGYDDSVQFALQGENSQWFSINAVQNSVTLVVSSAIPGAVLTDQRQLVFLVIAQRPVAITANATIIISLTADDYTEGSNIGFDRVTYLGSLQNDLVDLGPITIINGYTEDITLGLYGDLASYFTTTRAGPIVNVVLQTPIPTQMIPADGIITMDLRASAPNSATAYAAIVLGVVNDAASPAPVQLAFDAAYYIGSYNTSDGLLLEATITLSQGYDDSVQFALQGENSQWFSINAVQNSVTLVVSSAIPGAVLTDQRQLVFLVIAQRPGAITANATIIISLTADDYTEGSNIGFDRVTYLGSLQNDLVDLGPITIINGYTEDITLGLYGDLASYFTTTRAGPIVNVVLQTPIPTQMIPADGIITMDLRASAPNSATAYAAIVLGVVNDAASPAPVQLAFDAAYYIGSYSTSDGLLVEATITLSQGYDDSVQFALQGENSQWFSINAVQNSVTLVVSSAIPGAVLTDQRQLVFLVIAQRPGAITANATIIISLTADDYTEGSNIGFDRVTYLGSLQNDLVDLGPITIINGYTEDITLGLYGDLASYFTTTRAGPIVNVVLQTPIPTQMIPADGIITMDLRASAPNSATAYAAIVLGVVNDAASPAPVQLAFDAAYYIGSYSTSDGLLVEATITLSQGYDDSVQFALQGENSQWFSINAVQNSVTLVVSSAIPGAVLTDQRQLVFLVIAQRPGAITANATIIISLTADDYTEGSNIGFDRVTYLGSLQNDLVDLGPITIINGYTEDITLGLYGDLASYFTTTRAGPIVNVVLQTPIPTQMIPADGIITMDLRASAPNSATAYAAIVLGVVNDAASPAPVQLAFDAAYYIGSYNTSDGLLLEATITLSQGYDDSVQFALQGENSQWFSINAVQNSVTLVVSSAIPGAVLTDQRQLVFLVIAQRPGAITANATIVISLTEDSQTGDDVSFERVLYEGIIQSNEIQHEVIVISGYDGTNVDLLGEYSSLFVAYVTNGVVSVQASGSVTLPTDVTRLALELHAGGARAVLLLNVVQSDAPVLPSVSFSSESYVLTVQIVQTGLVGRVSATADNGEAVSYSLALDNAHLQTRLSINNVGELYLSAPANSGVYTFQVIATTVITQATGTATVYLTAEAVTVCGDNDIVVPPLIVLDRDEEEAHNNLVVLDSTQNGCHFSLTNRWPTDQNWLYVDENGLHTTAIDREHESIAFMALSQVQVELILHCQSDNAIRAKRSERTDWLGPYDYGTNKWILTDSIPYNSRRSLVNLIVNDINDNNPIFVGKEHEPIVVGYPIDELEERILPRSLAELKATDADIGENAALLYWSSESALAVAPTTGFVHVRSGARLQHDQLLTVSATDRNGEGLTGTIQLLVKLLDLNKIAVVTVRNAFLDDEIAVLANLSDAVGYEVKTLRSVVISDDIDEDVTRKNLESGTVRASLQLYVYGLIEREPVAVDRLIEDINSNAAVVSVVSTLPLEDHLEDGQINIIERDVGLLVATIVLSILLFILILLIAIWFFLRWRKNRNYDEFSDENSLASRNGSLGDLPKPETRPKLNIEDLKRSERRLQEMLSAPIEEVTVEPITSKKEAPLESVLDFPVPEVNAPIVIQSIDKLKDAEDSDDEFGEKNAKRRKSVVTFNENVEKIIHVEDDTDSNSQSGYEIYKL